VNSLTQAAHHPNPPRDISKLELMPAVLIGLTSLSGFVLMGLHNPQVGWPLLAATFIATILVRHPIRRHLPLVQLPLALLAASPINTDLDNTHFLIMGVVITLVVAIPYYVSAKIYGDHIIRFPLSHRRWDRGMFGYIGLTLLLTYLILPVYLISTGSYQNWTVGTDFESLFRLFLGANVLGLWDELFFIATVLAIYRRYLPFWWANIAQAVLFSSFLYELGFRGWGPLCTFPFAILQGLIFKRTNSLDYVVTIHLALDLVLYLVLIHAHHPEWLAIFPV
jgi:membrane protease YdiL (CAAX protease family)